MTTKSLLDKAVEEAAQFAADLPPRRPDPLVAVEPLSIDLLTSDERARVHELHWQQGEVLTSTAQYKVLAAGRKWGKCLGRGTLVAMADGTECRVESVRPGDMVLSVTDELDVVPRRVLAVIDNGIRESVTVRTSGRVLVCTPHHPILANQQWVDAGALAVGDLLAVPKATAFGAVDLPDHELVLLALWLAEGRDYGITNQSPEIVAEMMSAASVLGITPRSPDGLGWHLYTFSGTGGLKTRPSRNPFRLILERYGIWGADSKTKHIPDAIFALPPKRLARFLNLFIACDGCVTRRCKKTWSLEVGLANERMVRQVGSLLLKFGIRGQVRYKRHLARSSQTGRHFESWTLVVSDSQCLLRFCADIGAVGKEKAVDAATRSAAASKGSTQDYLPVSVDEFVQHMRRPTSASRVVMNSWRKQTRRHMTRRRYEQARGFSDGYFDTLADGGVAWEVVTSVERTAPVETWDLSVEENHSLIANGVVVHNSTLDETLLLQSAGDRPGTGRNIWHAYIGPNLAESRRIMWRPLVEAVPRSWIEKSPNQTRMEIELVTGQIIVCLGAEDPDSLRGMGFRRVIFDEPADMNLKKIWEPIILPNLLVAKGDAIWNGTPKGFDDFYGFYRRGVDGQPGWQSWQYMTRQAPHITPEMYAAIVAEYTDPRIMRQELEASFESASGTILGALWQAKKVVLESDTALLRLGLKVGEVIPWHVIDAPTWVPPKGSAIYGSVDYGFGAPCALYLHAVMPNGHIRTFWECYARELHDEQQARRILAAINAYNAKGVPDPQWIVGEPVMFATRREQRLAKTIAEVYADVLQSRCSILEGSSSRSIRMSRPQRWMTALGAAPDGLPWWTCTTACPALIETVPMVRWDEDDPEVEDPDGENHAFESCGRYFEARPIVPPKPIEDDLVRLDALSRAHHQAQEKRHDTRRQGGRTGLGNVGGRG